MFVQYAAKVGASGIARQKSYRGITSYLPTVRAFYLLTALAMFALSCSYPVADGVETYTMAVQELDDTSYPDDPDRELRGAAYSSNKLGHAWLFVLNDSSFSLRLDLADGGSILFPALDLNEWTPTTPIHLRGDPYLSLLSLVNQEWNRNQVAFRGNAFVSTDPAVTRVDVARNCLRSYLWEVILYATEDGAERPIGHGWFDFPAALYKASFKRRNNAEFLQFAQHLEDWSDPPRSKVNSTLLRRVIDAVPVVAKDRGASAYPMAGERAKKRKEIVHPSTFNSMQELCSDLTTFATFSPPGFYDRSDPRKTELGRFHHLVSGTVSRIMSQGQDLTGHEITLIFADSSGARLTHFVLGGMDLTSIPVLDVADANNGWAGSMGFGNHPFYETAEQHLASPSFTSNYYAYLTDGEGVWLDSHAVGFDGPLMHFTDPDRKDLHIWLLSFERHALVGHVSLTFPASL